jgi:hypothetical protein
MYAVAAGYNAARVIKEQYDTNNPPPPAPDPPAADPPPIVRVSAGHPIPVDPTNPKYVIVRPQTRSRIRR